MPHTTSLFEDGAVAEITRETFTVMIGAELLEIPPIVGPAAEQAALVHITGDTPCAVELVFSGGLGPQLAAAMFEMPVDELDEDSLADALGELANVVGGGVKSMLATPSQLSLPTVTISAASPHLPGSHPSETISFADGDGLLTVIIWRPHHAPVGPHGDFTVGASR